LTSAEGFVYALTASLISVRQPTDIETNQREIAMSNDTSKRGFASMDDDKQREIASKGGKAGGGDHASHEQHVQAGKQSSGGTHEQHVKAGEQSHKND
jgi:uncharacterized protein